MVYVQGNRGIAGKTGNCAHLACRHKIFLVGQSEGLAFAEVAIEFGLKAGTWLVNFNFQAALKHKKG